LLRVERQRYDHGEPVAGSDWERQLRRFQRAGFLKPDDNASGWQRGNESEWFLDLAVKRAFPAAPAFKGFCQLTAQYVFQPKVVSESMDPGDNYDLAAELEKNHQRSWIMLKVGDHVWCPVGRLFPYLEAKYPGFGRWLCFVIDSPFTVHPHEYLAWVGGAHWYGENDESMAKEEYEGTDPKDKWEGPTRADFDKLIPAWAQHLATFPYRDHARFLALARRLFGVDCSPLINGRGQRAFTWRDFLIPNGYLDAYERPIIFGWTDGDLVLETIDYAFNMAAQSEGIPDIVAAFCADNLPASAAKLAKVWRVMSTLDDLAEAFTQYRKDHKIV
jgi:hypothetical protein